MYIDTYVHDDMVNLASLNSFFPYFLKMREKKTKPVVYNVHFSSNFTEEKNFKPKSQFFFFFSNIFFQVHFFQALDQTLEFFFVQKEKIQILSVYGLFQVLKKD